MNSVPSAHTVGSTDLVISSFVFGLKFAVQDQYTPLNYAFKDFSSCPQIGEKQLFGTHRLRGKTVC